MNAQEQSKLAAYIVENYYDDPVGYCKDILQFIPSPWQEGALESLRDNRRTSIRSGHGVGKTKLAAAAVHWFMATRGYPRIRATANTEKQIMSVLWAELATVNREARNKELFDYSRTSFRLKDAPETHFAEAIAWSKEKPEAFAGIHAENVLYIYDEASGIDAAIWEVSQGAMTGKGARWLSLGNPTRNTGKFYECFGKNKWMGDNDTSRWHAFTVSCLDCPHVSKEYVDEIEREYGKDSDQYRVRVLGLPPLQETDQFISQADFDEASHRAFDRTLTMPRILGVDVAAFGDDRCAYFDRQGNFGELAGVRQGQDTMATVGDVVNLIKQSTQNPYNFVCVDVIGIGRGVYDRLVELQKDSTLPPTVKIVPVNVSETSFEAKKYTNKRAELWDKYKEWLKFARVDPKLMEDSCGIMYDFDSSGRLRMERKKDLKKRGLPSCDLADAVCMTFAVGNGTRASIEKPVRKPIPPPRYLSGRIT